MPSRSRSTHSGAKKPRRQMAPSRSKAAVAFSSTGAGAPPPISGPADLEERGRIVGDHRPHLPVGEAGTLDHDNVLAERLDRRRQDVGSAVARENDVRWPDGADRLGDLVEPDT